MKFSPRKSSSISGSRKGELTMFASHSALALATVLTLTGQVTAYSGANSASLARAAKSYVAPPPAATPPAPAPATPPVVAPTPAVPVVAAATAPSAPAPIPAKVLLRYKAEVGKVKRSRGVVAISVAGVPFKLNVKEVDKTTFTKVDAATGNITTESVTESEDTTRSDGGPLPAGDGKHETETTVTQPNGLIVSWKTTSEKPDEDAQSVRLEQASSIVFPDRAVTVGDKWVQEYKANPTLKTRDAHAEFEIVGAPKIAGVDAFKIKMSYKESGTAPIIYSGTYLIEVESGDELSSDTVIEGLNFGGQLASGTAHNERFEGGPLASSKNDSKAALAATTTPEKKKTIDEVIKEGYEKLPGYITLYRKKEHPTGPGSIYAELREDQIGQLMMLQATASTGTAAQVIEGDVISDLVFKFTRTPDDRLMLTVPNFFYRATDGTPIAKSIRRSFADAFLQSFTIDAKQDDRKSVLIDVSDLFKGDISQVSAAFMPSPFAGMMGGGGAYGMDREKTYIASLKNFPDNLVVSTQYNFMKMGPPSASDSPTLADSRSAPILVTYNLFPLPVDDKYKPTNGYRPRLADPRIGFFTGGEGGTGPNYVSYDDDSKEDPAVFYVERWDLKKKDPTAVMSEPVKPITFWIDNAIPLEYRDSVRTGLLTWNKGFEKLGFKNAIVVKQMPDNPDPKDDSVPFDTGDMRFNMVRWVTSPDGAYAVSLMRANPITGQILNASITVDAGIVHYTKLEHKALIDPSQAFEAGAGEGIELEMMQRQAAARKANGATSNYSLQSPTAFSNFADPRRCELGAGLKEQAWYGDLALTLMEPATGAGQVDLKEYTNQFLHEVVSHEMGHIMGLRHNFEGSAELSLKDLGSASVTAEQGLGASLMDYNPFNIMALRHKGVAYYAQTLGTYDYWAIEYGYSDIPSAKTTEDELPVLKRIASASTLKGHAYASDEIADQFDPMVTRFDLSSDPVAYWHKSMDLNRYLLVNLDKRLPKPGQSYWEFTRAFNELLGLYARGAGVASRYVGGLNVSRNHKGDPHEKPTLEPIDVAKQKEALALLNTYIFSPDALTFPQRYYTEFTTDPFAFSPSQDFPIRDQIASLQKSALRRLFSGSVLGRVANNEFKMGGDPTKALTLDGLFTSVSGNVWAEVDTHKNVPTLRRQLQRAYLDTMIDMVTSKQAIGPEDAKMLAWDQLRSLRTRLEVAQKPAAGVSYDTYTKLHLADSLTKVNRALNAGITLGASSSGGGSSLLQMLLGGDGSGDGSSAGAGH